MTVVRKKGSPYWYYSFTINGKTYVKSTKSTNKQQAQQIEERARFDVINSDVLNLPEVITLENALERYLHNKQGIRSISNLCAKSNKLLGFYYKRSGHTKIDCYGLPVEYVHEIQQKHIQELVENRREEGNTDSTIKQELLVLLSAISLARDCEMRVPPPHTLTIPKLTKNDPNKVMYLSEKEERRLLDELSPEKEFPHIDHNDRRIHQQRTNNYHFVIFLLDTGARFNEIASLKWESVDLEKKIIHLYRPKIKNESIIYISARLQQVLKQRKALIFEEDAYVFTNRDKTGPKNYNPQSFKKACERAGIENFSLHGLRHTYASRLIQGGFTLEEIGKMLGHTDIRLTQIYSHMKMDLVAKKVANFQNKNQE